MYHLKPDFPLYMARTTDYLDFFTNNNPDVHYLSVIENEWTMLSFTTFLDNVEALTVRYICTP